jgi:two-component system, NtrC family, response regulator GlrR
VSKEPSRTLPEPSAPSRQLLVQRFSVQVIDGPDEGASCRSDGGALTIGTHESARLILKDPMVSRFHCELIPSGGSLILEDRGSLNGTLVDGVPVVKAPLRSGAVLTLGRTRLRVDLGDKPDRVTLSTKKKFGVMVGSSPEMRRCFALLEKAAASDATVLLRGETGTGKELAAESLHREGARKEGPFVVVDCASIPANLLESELFGHERGAFTGAVAQHKGAFEAASGGTIFLDEIGELPLDLQPKLLRVLESRQVKRVGGRAYFDADVRVVAATHRDLEAEVNAQRFRSDLFYRLAVLEVRIPPLRQRADDLPLLVQHLLAQLGAQDRPQLRTAEFLDGLRHHSWPGNVRELRNYVERCLALDESMPPGKSDEPPPTDVAPAIDVTRPFKSARDQWLGDFERRYLAGVLEAHQGNVAAAARAAGLDRIYFYRLLWKYGLK